MSGTTDFVTFTLGGHSFDITAVDILELNRNLEVTPVPKSSPIVRGIMNLRGRLVPAIDMYVRLSLESLAPRTEAISIILRGDGQLLALLVDDAGEILTLDQDTFEPPPSNFSIVSRELVLGVHKLPDRLLLILYPKKLLRESNRHQNI